MLNLLQHPFRNLPHKVVKMKEPCDYILASQPCGTLYIGVTSNLPGRLIQHRTDAMPGFANQYGVHHLVRYEMCDTMEQAMLREKPLKRWHRQWKINLIASDNPHWIDLAVDLGLAPLAPNVLPDGC